jgi:hypothetical protein
MARASYIYFVHLIEGWTQESAAFTVKHEAEAFCARREITERGLTHTVLRFKDGGLTRHTAPRALPELPARGVLTAEGKLEFMADPMEGAYEDR